MHMKMAVLGGAGKMAKAVNLYLLAQDDVESVILADVDKDRATAAAERLGDARITATYANFNDHQSLLEVFHQVGVVVNCTIHYGNVKVMKACVETATHYVDLGGLYHTAQNQLKKNREFEQQGITGIVGAGNAPGSVNLMARYAVERLDTVDTICITSAGIDFTETKSPIMSTYAMDCILDEFSTEAVVFQDGEFRKFLPYSFSEGTTVEFPEPIGKNISNPCIHTEVGTLARSFQDKGVRNVSYNLALTEGFREKMKFLVSLGFASKEPISIGGTLVAPRDVLLALTASLEEEDLIPDDYKISQVIVKGEKGGRSLEYILELTCRADKENRLNTTSMATGFSGGIVGTMLGRGMVDRRGFFPIEACIEPEPYFKELARWGITVSCTLKKGALA